MAGPSIPAGHDSDGRGLASSCKTPWGCRSRLWQARRRQCQQWHAELSRGESLSTPGNPCHTDSRVLPANPAGEASGNSRGHRESLFRLSGFSWTWGRRSKGPKGPKASRHDHGWPLAPLGPSTPPPTIAAHAGDWALDVGMLLRPALTTGWGGRTDHVEGRGLHRIRGGMSCYHGDLHDLQLLSRKALNCLDAGRIPWLHVCVT